MGLGKFGFYTVFQLDMGGVRETWVLWESLSLPFFKSRNVSDLHLRLQKDFISSIDNASLDGPLV